MPLVGPATVGRRAWQSNERPDHPGKHIGDYYREALPLKLLDQAALSIVATHPVVLTG
jgi:hypothetical protein